MDLDEEEKRVVLQHPIWAQNAFLLAKLGQIVCEVVQAPLARRQCLLIFYRCLSIRAHLVTFWVHLGRGSEYIWVTGAFRIRININLPSGISRHNRIHQPCTSWIVFSSDLSFQVVDAVVNQTGDSIEIFDQYFQPVLLCIYQQQFLLYAVLENQTIILASWFDQQLIILNHRHYLGLDLLFDEFHIVFELV